MSAVRTAFGLLLLAAVAVLALLLLQHWMATKQYVFNREDVAKLAKQYAGGIRWRVVSLNVVSRSTPHFTQMPFLKVKSN